MFGKKRGVYAAQARFYGALDQPVGEIRMHLAANPDPPNIGYGRNALAVLVPLAAAKTLVLSTSAPGYSAPTLEEIHRCADLLLKDPVSLTFDRPDLPRFLDADAAESASATWDAALMQSRGGGYWVKRHAAMRDAHRSRSGAPCA